MTIMTILLFLSIIFNIFVFIKHVEYAEKYRINKEFWNREIKKGDERILELEKQIPSPMLERLTEIELREKYCRQSWDEIEVLKGRIKNLKEKFGEVKC